jgi:tetratricopeptide (TPR) repeat protein
MIYMRDDNYKEAEKALTSANTLAKGANAEVHWQLARVYNREARNQEAAKELEEYLKTSPDIKPDEKKNVRDLIDKMKNSKS